VDAELVLDGGALHVVPRPEAAVLVHQHLRHQEERDALHALGRAFHAGEHHVHDVVGEVVLAVGDEDLLPEEPVGAVLLRNGLGAHQREVAPRLRLGEVHGAGPFARDHLRQEPALEILRAHGIERLDRALREHRAELEREVRGAPHLLHRRLDEVRQALAAEFGGGEHVAPARLDPLPIRLAEAGGHRDLAVLVLRALAVAARVERREDLGGELARLLEDRVDHVVGEILPAGERVHLLEADHALQHELHVLQRCDVFGHHLLLFALPLPCLRL
jgi:hypothetical protein